MTHRYIRVLLGLLLLLAISWTSQDLHQATAQGGELPALPPNPEDWVCQESTHVVTPADIDSWCRLQVFRGLPAPAALQVPPPEADLAAKNRFDGAYQDFLRSRAYATDLGWQHDQTWRLTGPYIGPIGSGQSFGVHPAVRIYYSPEMIDWLCSDRADWVSGLSMVVDGGGMNH